MIDLKHVVTFLAITKQGNFSRAAEELDLAQPTVSLHIKSLEQALGYDLFDRIGKYAVITQAGENFLTTATELIKLAKSAEQIGTTGAPFTGTITLCIVQSICTYRMPNILRRFRQRCPQMRLHITVTRPSTYMLEQLRNGEFDAAIVLEAPFDIPMLASKSLWQDTLQVVTYPGHLLTKLPTISLQRLRHETFILPEKGAHYRKLFERRLQESGVMLESVMEINNVEAIKKCVMAEIGMAVLPSFTVENEIVNGQLCPLILDGRPLNITAQLIWHKDKVLSEPVKTLFQLIKDDL